MSDELESRLSRLAREVEAAWPAPDAGTSARLDAGVRRVRSTRTVKQSAAAVAALAVLVPAVVLGAGWLHASPPAVVPGPSPTSSASKSAAASTPAPTQSSSDQPASLHRDTDIDDATVRARIATPRTGETWTTPQRADEMAAVLAKGHDDWVPYLVGHRGAARIYAVVWDDRITATASLEFLAEVDDAGARQIACPSARIGDACGDPVGITGVAYDRTTFYDSLTIPSAIDLGSGWSVQTARTREGMAVSGNALRMIGGDLLHYETVATVGAMRVDMRFWYAPLRPVANNRSYVLVTPMGAAYDLDPRDLPGGDYDAIRWDDGVKRTVEQPAESAGVSVWNVGCGFGQFSEQDGFDRSGWVRAGATREGVPVYVPTRGNPLPDAVRADLAATTSEAQSGGPGAPVKYPYTTDAEFRDADALYAILGPDGQWQIRLRADAQAVLACDP